MSLVQPLGSPRRTTASHEQGPPAQVLGDPQQERTRQFLSRISA